MRDVNVGRALNETISSRGLLWVIVVGSAIYLIPYVGSFVALVLVAGYHVTYQRRVRQGLAGLPQTADFRDSLRRGLTSSLIVFSLLIPVIVVVLVLAFVAHLRSVGLILAVLASTIAVMVPCELLVMRYAVYDRWWAGFEFVQAFRVMRGHWTSWGRVVLWVVAAAAVIAGLRQVSGIGFGTKLTTFNVAAVAFGHPTGAVLLSLALNYAAIALVLLNGLVVTHMLGQLSAVVYAPGVETVPAPAPALPLTQRESGDDFGTWYTEDES
jgi:hypothetical protein